jgi:hypothetical protein
MPISAKRKLAVGAVGLAVLAGAGGAYAAGQSSSQTPTPSSSTPSKTPPKPADLQAEGKAFLDDLAKRLNVTRDQLDAAIKGAAEARIDAAVAAGKLTKDQGEQLKKRLANGVPMLGGPLLGGGPRGPHGPGGPGGGPGRGFGFGFGFGLDGAADYLGLTEQQLREQLRSGKSLADIAKATNGKSVDGLKAALKAKVSARLAQAVKDKHLTQAQADKIAAGLDQHLDDIVNNTPPKGGPKLRFRHP